MKNAKNSSGVAELLEISARAQRLGQQASAEPQAYLTLGRLARDPHDMDAISRSIIDVARRGDFDFSKIDETPRGYISLQYALWHSSMLLWEEMWNDAHPDQFGCAWHMNDPALMSLWRERVRNMIKECHVDAILALSRDEYLNRLAMAGMCEKDAIALAEWIAKIHVGDPPLLE
jgi:hypothetical protein